MIFRKKNGIILFVEININKEVHVLAHSKSAKKRVRVAERNRVRNLALKSRLKTMLKKFEVALDGEDMEAAKQALAVAYKELDKAVAKGILKKNTASRKKSRLAIKLNKALSA